MCGICGLWNLNGTPVSIELLESMRDIMTHRGPDGSGSALFSSSQPVEPILFQDRIELSSIYHQGASYNVGLGHRRLAIIDLSTGNQPMANEDGTIWIVFNGEIYNYRELREELRTLGHIFRTASDTEVILHAYEEWGKDCPTRLNGIFAFAIWDGQRCILFLARDHFGVKPLYYCLHEERFYFASELKAILCDSTVPRELDLDALNLCLTFRHTPSPWTLLKHIRKLPPGNSLLVTPQGVQENRYWQDTREIDRKPSEKEWVERLQIAVDRAVERQMVSDVPIGISLSSGVDSTTLMAIMSQYSEKSVSAFTVGFAGREDQSEIEPARRMAKRFGAMFHGQMIASKDYAEFMERYMWHLEEPIGNDSAAAYYFVAKMAHQHGVKVLLNGQGADEAFAGYKRYFGIANMRWLRLTAVTPMRQVISRILRASVLGESYQRLLFALEARNEDELFLNIYSILTDNSKHRLIQPKVLAQMDAELPLRYVREQLTRAPNGNLLEKMTYVDVRTSLADNLLLCEDKMAMATSVEARVPFLDLELMALAESIPGKFKLRRRRDKYIHREACARWIPREAAFRPQSGFDNALSLWLREELGAHIRDVITSSDSFTNNYLNQEYVMELITEHNNRQRDHLYILFLLFSLETWYHSFGR